MRFARVPYFKRVVLVGLVCLTAQACFGGGGDGEEAAPRTASVVFINEVADLGAVEVLVDGELLRLVEPGELTEAVALPIGDKRLSLRNPGASADLIGQEINFVEQTYLVAFTGSSAGGTLGLFLVDEQPPALTKEEHAVEVVNLRTDSRDLNIFVGTELLAEGPDDRSITPFAIVEPGEVIIGVSTPEGAPLVTSDVTLSEGGATMVLVGGVGEDVTIDHLSVRQ
jgi:hypothetical protein